MNWKLKANIQRVCAALPASEAIYYLVQSKMGSFRNPDPMPNLRDAAVILKEFPTPPIGKRVIEVGTGRRLDMPMAFYLAGAASIDTMDLHRYLKPDLVIGSLRKLLDNRDEVRSLYAPFSSQKEVDSRLDGLASVTTLGELSKCANIRYHAPTDARKTGFPSGSFDIQFSFTVFEHIPGEVLRDILIEARRLLDPQTGFACHHIDLSDHCYHVDKSINQINFLRFSEAEWSKYNDNQFAYHNRLRAAEYAKIYEQAGHEILKRLDFVDDASLKDIEQGFPLDAKYRGLDAGTLATVAMRVTSKKAR